MRNRGILVVSVTLLFACLLVRLGQGASPPDTRHDRPAAAGPVGGVTKGSGGATTGGIRPTDHAFFIHDLGHRCWDFGAEASWAVGNPVFINSCNGTVAQQVRVRETDLHDVHLGVTSLFCIGVRGGKVVPGAPLELQVCNDASPAQRFAVDGDAVLMGSQTTGPVTREFAIAPQAYHTVARTPLVVFERRLSDAEYFTFEATEHATVRPTSGFVHVFTEAALDDSLELGWGTVIEIDDQQPLELKGPFPKVLHAGVTLRGYRKYTHQGPEVRTCVSTTPKDGKETGAFLLKEDSVRITGMRIRGQHDDPRCPNNTLYEDPVIFVQAPNHSGASDPKTGAATEIAPRTIVDRVEISFWEGSGVDIRGTDSRELPACWPDGFWPFPRDPRVRVIGNFLHHNYHYGIVTGQGGFTLAQGNVAYQNRAHAIASDPRGGYEAFDNIILSNERPTHPIDVHGSVKRAPDGESWQGGYAGDYFDIGWNTLLSSDHMYVDQRGTPCRFTAIHHNIFFQPVEVSSTDQRLSAIFTVTLDPAKNAVYANRLVTKDPRDNYTQNAVGNDNWLENPMLDLGVGDFDGDGLDDVFVGTGAGWYFSSGAQGEWRFLNRMPERASALLFADLDGDGRTDVIALHAGHIDVSWAGLSDWQTINATNATIADLAVGDFDGDGHPDLFLATGTEWFWAPGGTRWISLGPSRYRRAQLLFGDFTHIGHTQILRISNGFWQLGDISSQSNTVVFATLNRPDAQPGSVDGMLVGDFDHSGFADEVARVNTQTGAWEYTGPQGSPGFPGWHLLRNGGDTRRGVTLARQGVVGRFSDGISTDIVVWHDVDFYVARRGRDPLTQISRQDMR